jgi:uncharacterized RDD family membrane protein YckC
MRTNRPSDASRVNEPAGLLRRLGALLYDSLLLAAVLMLATGLMLLATGGEAIRSDTHPILEWVYRLMLVALTVGFFGLFWTRSGQTLGMAAWRIKVVREDGHLPGWRDTALRIGAALLSWLPAGLGYFWMLVDREQRTWHDRLSRTKVVQLPK